MIADAPLVETWPDGRLRLRHGPIDLLIEAEGPAGEVQAAYRQAAEGFPTLLPDLVEELAVLRRPLTSAAPEPTGLVARRMVAATRPLAERFVTPMAAVAGAVADEVLARICAGRRLARAYVNNGGDIALHLAPGASWTCGLVADLEQPSLDANIALDAASPVRGVATSGRAAPGRGGRSFSLGIADAVTILAGSAAEADVAATLIANAVDLPSHPTVRRAPARDLDPDSDLGARLVTLEVGPLSDAEIRAALARGARCAETFRQEGLIIAACLALRGQMLVSGRLPALERAA